MAKALCGILHTEHAGVKIYRKKKGNQQAMKLPIIKPNINVALFSFFLAILLFSLSGSLGFWGLGNAGSNSAGEGFAGSGLLVFVVCFLPNIGWQSLNFNGLTTAHLLTTPESELEGSNSETISVSIPTDGALALAEAEAWSSPLTDSEEPRKGPVDIGLLKGMDVDTTCEKHDHY